MSDTSPGRHAWRGEDPDPSGETLAELRHERDDVLAEVDVLDEDVVRETARSEAEKVSRRWGLIAAIFAILLSLGVSTASFATASQASTRSVETQRTVSDALTKLSTANEELQSRGQAPVETGPDPDAAEAIQAAVLAQVLAKLPPAPTPEQVAEVLQPAVSAQVVGPSRDTLAQLVAAYFRDNPTAPQIQAAVAAYLQQNPPARGPQGERGLQGDRGEKGDKGDSPACLAEASACRGADGSDSTVQGPPGPPPASWTWTDALMITHTCTRSGGPDDAAVYSCT